MNDMSNPPIVTDTDLDTLFGEKSTGLPAPTARSPSPLIIGRQPPHKGFWVDPETGAHYSGGMEIPRLGG